MGEALNIAIAGAGIAGLSLGIALAQRGQAVDVYEQAESIAEVGAGLQISPNGSAVLAGLGLAEPARAAAVTGQAIALNDWRGGPPLARLDLTRAGHGNRHPYLFLHRADLIALLRDRAVAAGVRIHLGQRVDPSRGPPGGADLLAGADGLHSAVRQRLNGTMAPFFTGQVAWRALVPGNGAAEAVARVWMAPRRHIVAYPLRDGALINLVAVEERRSWVAEGWFHPDEPDNLRDAFAGFAPEVRLRLGVRLGAVPPSGRGNLARRADGDSGRCGASDAAVPRAGGEHGAGGCVGAGSGAGAARPAGAARRDTRRAGALSGGTDEAGDADCRRCRGERPHLASAQSGGAAGVPDRAADRRAGGAGRAARPVRLALRRRRHAKLNRAERPVARTLALRPELKGNINA